MATTEQFGNNFEMFYHSFPSKPHIGLHSTSLCELDPYHCS